MSGFKEDIPSILIKKFLCQVFVLLTLLEFIYRFTSKNRIQPKLENFSGAAMYCCGSYRGTSLFTQCLLCRLMKYLLTVF